VANIIQKDITRWEVFFDDMPEWIIPLIRLIPIFYTISPNDMTTSTLSYDFNYFWEKVENQNYRLYIYLSGQLKNQNNDIIPLYVNLSAWIVNKNNRISLQHDLGY
jgi:hypothetical protein